MTTDKLLSIKIEGKLWYFIQPFAYQYNTEYSKLFQDIDNKLIDILFEPGDIVECEMGMTNTYKRFNWVDSLYDVVHECVRMILGELYEDQDCLPEFNIKDYGFFNENSYIQVKPKTDYIITLNKPRLGTILTNKLEGTYYKTNLDKPYVLKGLLNEEWTVSYFILTEYYTLEDGTKITVDLLESFERLDGTFDNIKIRPKENTKIRFATRVVKDITNLPIRTRWNEITYANRDDVDREYGDMIVCSCKEGLPNFNDMWVVNGDVFKRTYSII